MLKRERRKEKRDWSEGLLRETLEERGKGAPGAGSWLVSRHLPVELSEPHPRKPILLVFIGSRHLGHCPKIEPHVEQEVRFRSRPALSLGHLKSAAVMPVLVRFGRHQSTHS